MLRTELLKKVDAAIVEKNLLNHPFYQDWQAGKLSREALRLYSVQYYQHVAAFPRHLRVLADRADGQLREIVTENLAEEENPAAPHPNLWKNFAAALGVTQEEISSSLPLPGTRALVDTFHEIVSQRPTAEAVAALYAYEAQVPEIATTKIDGLKRFYGVSSPKALAYFEVHEEADKAHRAAWRNWLLERAQGEEEGILATAHEALDTLWGALDAVHAARA